MAELLSGATEPIPVNWTHVHFLAEADNDAFHDSDPRLPADEDICLLNDTLEAMLVEDPVADHQGHADRHPATPPLVTSESVSNMDRELLMSDTNPVRLTAECPDRSFISFFSCYTSVHRPYQHLVIASPHPSLDARSRPGILCDSPCTRSP